jgi:hypothetical protein
VQVPRKAFVVIAVVVLALAAAGAWYYRYRVNKAVAECAMPAPPEKPATPPPNLPGFQSGDACGPGETKTAVPTSTGKKP